MRSNFVVGDYKYTRSTQEDKVFWDFVKLAKGAKKTLTWSKPSGEGYVSDQTGLFLALGKDSLYKFVGGVSKTVTDSRHQVTYNGAYSITIQARQNLDELFELNVYFYSEALKATAIDKSKTSYPDIPSVVSDEGTNSNVTDISECFRNCPSLTEAPTIPSTVNDMSYCFRDCPSLTEAPTIPSTVKYMHYCFCNCPSLTEAPTIPSTVYNMSYCFYGCTTLAGEIEVYSSPSYETRMFAKTEKDIFIINKGSGETVWKNVASEYANVHYEADDNPMPVVSNLSAIRVSSDGSTTPESTGLYAYIQARVMAYETVIPAGWTNEVKDSILKDNGSVETVTWLPSPITEYPADIHCWVYLGDTSTHSISLQIYDSVKENGVEKRSSLSVAQTTSISKSYALVDYYHDPVTNTEGMSIGKYAEHADLLDIDMPTMFRQSVTAQTWAGFIQMFAGATAPSGWLFCDGSEVAVADYPLLHGIIGNTYGTPSDSDHFVLPDLQTRFPIGADDASYPLGDTGGSADAIVPYHRHSVSAVTNAITGGSHHHATYRKKNAGSGSAIYVPDGGSTANGISTTDTTHTHNLPAHNTNYEGVSGKEIGANIPPYIGINFIICTGEIQ